MKLNTLKEHLSKAKPAKVVKVKEPKGKKLNESVDNQYLNDEVHKLPFMTRI